MVNSIMVDNGKDRLIMAGHGYSSPKCQASLS